jgi:hypothetical protein
MPSMGLFVASGFNIRQYAKYRLAPGGSHLTPCTPSTLTTPLGRTYWTNPIRTKSRRTHGVKTLFIWKTRVNLSSIRSRSTPNLVIIEQFQLFSVYRLTLSGHFQCVLIIPTSLYITRATISQSHFARNRS